MWCGVLAGVFDQILFWVKLCQFLLSVGPVRVRTSLYKCTVQCTAVENTVQSGLQHCSHSRLGREAWDVRRSGPGREWSSLQSSKFETHSAVSQHKNCTKTPKSIVLCKSKCDILFLSVKTFYFTSLFCLLQMSKFRAKEWIRDREMGDEKIMDLSVEKGKRWVW